MCNYKNNQNGIYTLFETLSHFSGHYPYFTRFSYRNLLFFEGLPENKNSRNSLNFRSLLRFFILKSDPPGIRTQDPNIKSVVLYLLS